MDKGKDILDDLVGDAESPEPDEELPKAPDSPPTSGTDTFTEEELEQMGISPEPSNLKEPVEKAPEEPPESRITVEELCDRMGMDRIDELLARYGSASAVPALCEHGCFVEPDGHCPHGNPSVLLDLNIL